MKNLFVFLLLGLFANFSLTAQNMIEGGISNEIGESLILTSITLEHKQDATLNKTMITDEYGYFIMDNLVDGNYRIVVEKNTFETITLDNFEFPRDKDIVLGVTMKSIDTLAYKENTVVRQLSKKGAFVELYK